MTTSVIMGKTTNPEEGTEGYLISTNPMEDMERYLDGGKSCCIVYSVS